MEAQAHAGAAGLLEVRRTGEALDLELTGQWRALRFPEIDAALGAVDLTGVQRVQIAAGRVELLDLTGAWRLREFMRTAAAAGAAVGFRGTPPISCG